ncbi:MAG: hypothetical protein OXF60_10820 [Gammaproteobacteria bacterium]|nr:hypothetical protein [Gammaproteobacteria bacterium]
MIKILPYKTAKSNRKITARSGLMVPTTLLERLGLGSIVDQQMPTPGSNRGYRHSTLFHTFILMLHEVLFSAISQNSIPRLN